MHCKRVTVLSCTSSGEQSRMLKDAVACLNAQLKWRAPKYIIALSGLVHCLLFSGWLMLYLIQKLTFHQSKSPRLYVCFAQKYLPFFLVCLTMASGVSILIQCLQLKKLVWHWVPMHAVLNVCFNDPETATARSHVFLVWRAFQEFARWKHFAHFRPFQLTGSVLKIIWSPSVLTES